MILYSTGCHSGYNTVNAHGVPNLTIQPDWAQALARKGAVLIGGTGYQYGDADLMEYGERLYLGFTRQLRRPGAIPIGQALVRAKQEYMADTGVALDGVFEKGLLVSALFGLPMLRVEMPGQPSAQPVLPAIVSATQPVTTGPGVALGLLMADVTVAPVVTATERTLTSALDQVTTYRATALLGKDGAVARPGQPLLPLAVYNVSAPGGLAGGVLRGVGLRGASYADQSPIFPLTGAPATEVAGVRSVFRSMSFYPSKPWTVNYFANLADAVGGVTRLMLTPAQFKSSSPASLTGVLRTFASLDFRLYYSRDLSQAALAAPPSLAQVAAENVGGGNIQFRVHATDPLADVQAVWVTYTGITGPLAGLWRSLDLQQDSREPALWTGRLPVGTIPIGDLRYMVQAVNGVGLVTLATNNGEYFTPGVDPGNPATQPTPEPDDAHAAGAAQHQCVRLHGHGQGRVAAPSHGQGRVAEPRDAAARPECGIRPGDADLARHHRRRWGSRGQIPAHGQAGRLSVAGYICWRWGLCPGGGLAPFVLTKQDTTLALNPTNLTVQSGDEWVLVATLQRCSTASRSASGRWSSS